MIAHLQLFIPSLPELLGLGAVTAISALMIGLGAWVGGPARRVEADLIYGWAVVILVFTVAGSLGITRFTIVAALLGCAALVAGLAAWRRDRRLLPAGAARIALLALPLIAIATTMIPTQWDEFTHWLPNARYLLEFDSVPRADLPKSPAVMESYPYAVPLVMFMASRITGFMTLNASAIFSLFLYLSFGLLIARIIVATAKGSADGEGPTNHALNSVPLGWTVCALGALSVTILNPTFVTRLVFSSYADAPTGIVTGIAAILIWLMTNALAENDVRGARTLAWQAGLGCTAMLGLKQVNLVFLMALALSLAIIVLRDPAIGWRPMLALVLRIFILPLIVYVLWKLHVSHHIPGGEFSFRGFSEWLIRDIPQIISRMALVASKKGGYFGVMSVAVILAILSVWRPRAALGRLAIITGVMFLSYNGFLLLAYVSAFQRGEALHAASYWRYNTHLGGVCLAFAAYGGALVWQRFVAGKMPRFVPALAIALVVVLPVGMAKKLRFDNHPRYHYAWDVGRAIASHLTAADRILLVDPADNGQYQVIMRYILQSGATVQGEITSWSKVTSETLQRLSRSPITTHVWLFEPTQPIRQAFDVDLAAGRSWLLRRNGSRWTPVDSWPHPVR